MYLKNFLVVLITVIRDLTIEYMQRLYYVSRDFYIFTLQLKKFSNL